MTTNRLTLDARIDSAGARQLARDVADLQGADLVLDAGKLDHLGALAVQTLLVAGHAWASAGHRIVVENLSPEVHEQLASLGFADLDPIAIGADP